MRKLLAYALGLVALCFSCSGSENTYSTGPAAFTMSPVTQVSQLYTALNSPGEYCMIWRSSQTFYFANQYGSQTSLQATSLTGYQTWISPSGNGFIVGKMNIPEVGATDLSLVAYDRTCPNCYVEANINRALDFSTYGFLKCSRCKRTYDMNNGGYVVDSTGVKLFRYHIAYAGITMNIYN